MHVFYTGMCLLNFCSCNFCLNPQAELLSIQLGKPGNVHQDPKNHLFLESRHLSTQSDKDVPYRSSSLSRLNGRRATGTKELNPVSFLCPWNRCESEEYRSLECRLLAPPSSPSFREIPPALRTAFTPRGFPQDDVELAKRAHSYQGAVRWFRSRRKQNWK